MSVSTATRYRLDDFRRFASELLTAVGVAPTRASEFASHLLWFDAAGASNHGILTLGSWLERIDRKEIDPRAEGRASRERAGTAVFESKGGLAPLALIKAAGIAGEKARDVGIGIVRVMGLGSSGPSAPIAADLAVGPFLALILGPGGSFSMAVPTASGLPAIYDPALGSRSDRVGSGPLIAPDWLEAFGPWVSALSGPEGYSILAMAIPAMESLTTFHDRIARSFSNSLGGPGVLLPGPWEASRREVRERGIAFEEEVSGELRIWANRLGIPWPSRLGR